MQSPQEFLLALGIKLASYGVGTHQTTCPKCSANRQKRLAKCLTVRIGSDRIYGGCNHCGWTFPEPGSAKGSRPDSRIYHLYPNGNRKVRNRGGTPPCAWQHQDADGTWVKGSKDLPPDALYRYDEVIKILQEHGSTLIAIAEGESDVDALWLVGIPATCNAHGASETGKRPKWTKAHSEKLGGARLCVFNDNDGPGYAHAETVVKCSTGISQEVRRLDLKDHWPEIGPGGDVRDFLNAHDFVELIQLMDKAPIKANGHAAEPHKDDPTDAEIDRLARASETERAKSIKPTAKTLGIRVGDLEKLVKLRRGELHLVPDNKQGKALEFEEPEPWLEEIHTDDLLNELVRQVKRFLVLPLYAAEIIALWVLHTYVFRCWEVTPRLHIVGPTKGVGKSRLLSWLKMVVYRPQMAGNLTASSFFRTVAKHSPTMLIDELDSFVQDDSEIRNAFNEGYSIDGCVLRTVGDDHEPRQFSCFAPAAYAHIGTLSHLFNPLLSRSFDIRMQKKQSDELIESIRLTRKTDAYKDTRRKCVRWANDHRDKLSANVPEFPASISDDRVRDNAESLLAIAELGGAEWKVKGREAVVGNVRQQADRDDWGEWMLADTYEYFVRFGKDKELATLLADELGKLDHWKEMGRARKPITTKQLAKILEPFEVESRRENDGRWYHREDFERHWKAYLSELNGKKDPPPPGTSVQASLLGVNPLTNQVTDRHPPKRHSDACASVTDDLAEWAEVSEPSTEITEKPPEDDDVPFF